MSVSIASRRELKAALSAVPKRKPNRFGLLLLATDCALWVGGLLAVILPSSVVVKCLGSMLLWIASARMFIVGHDASHGSLTTQPRLNLWLARLAFLPTLTPASLWSLGHNTAHHGYTNLKAHDYVWAPLAIEEYRAMPPWRRRLERVYRSGWGPGLYYLIELWWTRLYFPNRKHVGARRADFTGDCLAVSAFAVTWIATLLFAAQGTHQPSSLLVALGFAIPFLLWNWLMGFVVYVHHTHPGVRWFDQKLRWTKEQTYLRGTVHVEMPYGVNKLLHSIFDHTVHHIDPTISLFSLGAAQLLLESQFPEHVVVQRFSWSWYFDTANRCQLYDYRGEHWLSCKVAEANS